MKEAVTPIYPCLALEVQRSVVKDIYFAEEIKSSLIVDLVQL